MVYHPLVVVLFVLWYPLLLDGFSVSVEPNIRVSSSASTTRNKFKLNILTKSRLSSFGTTKLEMSSSTTNTDVAVQQQQQQQRNEKEEQGRWKQCMVNLDTFELDDPPFFIPNEKEEEWSEEAYQSALELYHSFTTTSDTYLQSLINDALQTLANAYRLYGPNNVIGSYNGGKDAVVIFHLMRAAHAKYYHDILQQQQQQQQQGNNNKQIKIIRPRVIYFEHNDEFVQVEHFLKQTIDQFDCFMLSFPKGTGFSNGLKLLVQNNYPFSSTNTYITNNNDIPTYPMAFVLGTRSSDPNAGSQQNYAPSSSYMPPFMRINPIIGTYALTYLTYITLIYFFLLTRKTKQLALYIHLVPIILSSISHLSYSFSKNLPMVMSGTF